MNLQSATQGALGALKYKMASLKTENDGLREQNEECKKEAEKWKDEVGRVGVRFSFFIIASLTWTR